ncbi:MULTISPECIES: transposase [unclassified Streptomyces]|uniref:transposase n=1 Tax=unclassified Streptomyces TaxID=2593676 RepID=UPI003B63B27D
MRCWAIRPGESSPGCRRAAGRPRVPDRQELCGILFVLHTGIQWEYLPPGTGLRKLWSAKKLDWSMAVIDSSHVRAARMGSLVLGHVPRGEMWAGNPLRCLAPASRLTERGPT